MKFFNRTSLALSAAFLLSAASLLAQGPGGFHRGGGDKFLATALDLTDAQQTQLKTIHTNERTAAQPIMQQLKTQREAVDSAIQSGQSAEAVAQLASQEGTLLGQLEGIRASTRQQTFAILTPAQQQKFLALHKGGAGHRPEPGTGPGTE